MLLICAAERWGRDRMTKSKVYLWIQGLLCAVLAAMLICAALGIYREGIALREAGDALAWIYTKEKIAERLAPIAPVFCGAALTALVGLILGVRDQRAERPVPDAAFLRDALATEGVPREKSYQRRCLFAGWGIFTACMIAILVYLLRPAHFPENDLEGMFSSLAGWLIPWAALGLSGLALFSQLREQSIKRELAAGKARTAKQRETKGGERRLLIVRTAVLALALGMILAGALNGGMRDVLIKAINLCTECVGLG